jgi:hypothetical protein
MARCFLTGVEFRVEDGHVLNRTDAYRLLRTLRRRSESLDRLLAQLSPLDEPVAEDPRVMARTRGRQHRMICKAVAGALAQAYPEIELFLSWPALLARGLKDRMRLLKEHPLYGASISALSDEDLVAAAKLSQQVVRLIDPRRELPHRARLAIKAGICVRHRAESAKEIAALIRSTISRNGDLAALGVPEEEHEPVRANLMRVVCTPPRNPSSHERQ